MTKTTLRSSITEDVHLLGISCALRDYRLAWAINQYSFIELNRKDDWGPFKNSHYLFENKHTATSYHLLANKGLGGFLVPENQEFEYFLLIRNLIEPELLRELHATIKKIADVLLVQQIQVQKLRTLDILFVE